MSVLSIVLPVYNGERYLAEAIESVLAQSYEDWELIIVDDGSSDNSLAIAQRYANKDSRIHVLALDQNGGLPNALNQGFVQANGRFHSWSSHDNRYAPEAFAKLVEALEQSAADLVYSDYALMDALGDPAGERRLPHWHRLAESNVIGACFAYQSALFDALEGYEDQYRLAEDYAFWLKAAAAGKQFHHIPSILYAYRQHDASLSQQHTEPTFAASHAAWCAYVPILPWLTPRGLAKAAMLRFARQNGHSELLQIAFKQSTIMALAMLPYALLKRLQKNMLTKKGAS